MAWDDETLKRTFEKTAGRCHLCEGGLVFKNYGNPDARGSWEVEHSVPKAKGGTDHMNNLFPAHVTCNRSKGTIDAAVVRASNGLKRTPMSARQIQAAKKSRAVRGAAAGLALGLGTRVALGAVFAPLGPLGWVLTAAAGAAIGGAVAHDEDPEE